MNEPASSNVLQTSSDAAEGSARGKFTARNRDNLILMIIGLVIMRVFDVSQGDWERIEPAASALLEFLLPIFGIGGVAAAQQYLKKDD